jgi:hypothetical protein
VVAAPVGAPIKKRRLSGGGGTGWRPIKGGKNATKQTARGKKVARSRARHNGSATKQSLYRRAKGRGIVGRSKMSKRQLENALQ